MLSAEAAVLHAIILEDEDEAVRLLRDFLPGELVALARQASRLTELATAIYYDKARTDG